VKNPWTSSFKGRHSPLFELARVLVRLDYIASIIVNANDGVMRSAVELRIIDCVADCVRLAIPQAPEWQRIED